jgi:hypothetical protein
MNGTSLAHDRVTAKIGKGSGRALSPDATWALSIADPFGEPLLELLPTGPSETRELPALVYLVDVDDGTRRVWRDLAPSDMSGISGIDYLAVKPGGDGYVYSYRRLLSTLYVTEGLR